MKIWLHVIKKTIRNYFSSFGIIKNIARGIKKNRTIMEGAVADRIAKAIDKKN